MIKKKENSEEINRRDVKVTTNSFTQAVKKAGAGGVSMAKPDIEERASEEDMGIPLQAYDDLMRAKEAKNDTSVEGEKYRRDE